MCEVCEPSWSKGGPFCEPCPPGAALAKWSPVGLGFFIAGLTLLFLLLTLPVLLSSLIAPALRAWALRLAGFGADGAGDERGVSAPQSDGNLFAALMVLSKLAPKPKCPQCTPACLTPGGRRERHSSDAGAADSGGYNSASSSFAPVGGDSDRSSAIEAELASIERLRDRVMGFIAFLGFSQVPVRMLIGARGAAPLLCPALRAGRAASL